MDDGNQLVAVAASVLAKAASLAEEATGQCAVAAADRGDASSEMNEPTVPWADCGHYFAPVPIDRPPQQALDQLNDHCYTLCLSAHRDLYWGWDWRGS